MEKYIFLIIGFIILFVGLTKIWLGEKSSTPRYRCGLVPPLPNPPPPPKRKRGKKPTEYEKAYAKHRIEIIDKKLKDLFIYYLVWLALPV
jgi:hypothetical protein